MKKVPVFLFSIVSIALLLSSCIGGSLYSLFERDLSGYWCQISSDDSRYFIARARHPDYYISKNLNNDYDLFQKQQYSDNFNHEFIDLGNNEIMISFDATGLSYPESILGTKTSSFAGHILSDTLIEIYFATETTKYSDETIRTVSGDMFLWLKKSNSGPQSINNTISCATVTIIRDYEDFVKDEKYKLTIEAIADEKFTDISNNGTLTLSNGEKVFNYHLDELASGFNVYTEDGVDIPNFTLSFSNAEKKIHTYLSTVQQYYHGNPSSFYYDENWIGDVKWEPIQYP